MDPLKVLLIDDDCGIRWVLNESLRASGIDVTAVSCVEEACEALDDGQFDVIVSDIQMPGTNGYNFGAMLREASLKVPVVAISGLIDPVKAESAGFAKTLLKPFSRGELLGALAEVTAKIN